MGCQLCAEGGLDGGATDMRGAEPSLQGRHPLLHSPVASPLLLRELRHDPLQATSHRCNVSLGPVALIEERLEPADVRVILLLHGRERAVVEPGLRQAPLHVLVRGV